MMTAGFLRAYGPLDKTDLPFLIFMVAPVLYTIFPPNPVLLSGPLCAPSTFFSAAERVVRAVGFACVFCTFVFVSMPPLTYSGSTLTVIRAFTSSAWVLSSPQAMLVLVFPQCAFAVWSRLAIRDRDRYDTIPMTTPPPEREDSACVDSASAAEAAEHASAAEHAFTTVSMLAEAPTASTRIFTQDELAKIAARL